MCAGQRLQRDGCHQCGCSPAEDARHWFTGACGRTIVLLEGTSETTMFSPCHTCVTSRLPMQWLCQTKSEESSARVNALH